MSEIKIGQIYKYKESNFTIKILKENSDHTSWQVKVIKTDKSYLKVGLSTNQSESSLKEKYILIEEITFRPTDNNLLERIL